jgi:hypothetical protein
MKVKVSDKYLRDLLREIVKLRAGGVCEYPGCTNTDGDPHHWFSSRNLSIKYWPDACLYLCAFHHTASQYSAHKAPFTFKKKIIQCGVRTEAWKYEVLRKAAQIVTVAPAIYRVEMKQILLAERERLAA